MRHNGKTYLIQISQIIEPSLYNHDIKIEDGCRHFRWFLDGIQDRRINFNISQKTVLQDVSIIAEDIILDPLWYDDALLREYCVAIFVEELMFFISKLEGINHLTLNGLDIRMVGDVIRVDVP